MLRSHSAPSSWPSHTTPKPITSPTTGLSGGPWREGAARFVEGRIGEEPPPLNLDQDGRPADVVMRTSVMGYRSLNAWPERRRNAAVSAQAAAANTAAAAANRIPGESSSGPR
jgi:hypothetical protein